MIDPISAVAGGMSIVQGVVQLYKFLAAQGDRVISAYFDDYGEPLHGDELIKINVHRENKEAIIWWFEVNPIKDYVFIRAPVIETSVIEIPGQNKEEKNPDTKYWRWIAPNMPGTIVGGNYIPPNELVNFIVVGYRPSELLKRRET